MSLSRRKERLSFPNPTPNQVIDLTSDNDDADEAYSIQHLPCPPGDRLSQGIWLKDQAHLRSPHNPQPRDEVSRRDREHEARSARQLQPPQAYSASMKAKKSKAREKAVQLLTQRNAGSQRNEKVSRLLTKLVPETGSLKRVANGAFKNEKMEDESTLVRPVSLPGLSQNVDKDGANFDFDQNGRRTLDELFSSNHLSDDEELAHPKKMHNGKTTWQDLAAQYPEFSSLNDDLELSPNGKVLEPHNSSSVKFSQQAAIKSVLEGLPDAVTPDLDRRKSKRPSIKNTEPKPMPSTKRGTVSGAVNQASKDQGGLSNTRKVSEAFGTASHRLDSKTDTEDEGQANTYHQHRNSSKLKASPNTLPPDVDLQTGLSPSAAKRYQEYSKEEDEKLVRLKANENLSWNEITAHFPARTRGSLQVHWSTKLKGSTLAKSILGGSGPSPQPEETRPVMPQANAVINEETIRMEMDGLPERYEDDNPPSSSSSSCSEAGSSTRVPSHKIYAQADSQLVRRFKPSSRRHERDGKSRSGQWAQRKFPKSLYEPHLGAAEVLPEKYQLNVLRQGPFKLMQLAHGLDHDTTGRARSQHFQSKERQLVPYVSSAVRSLVRNISGHGMWNTDQVLHGWNNVVLHQDFNEREASAVLSSISRARNNEEACTHTFTRSALQRASSLLTEQQMDDVVRVAKHHFQLVCRSGKAIKAFLEDAKNGRKQHVTTVLRTRIHKSCKRENVALSLRHRELSAVNKSGLIKQSVYDSLGPALSFTGTSGDVGTLSWGPEGSTFAAGSMCLVDEDSMQYNRPNNLLFGNVPNRTLHELPGHNTRRQKACKGVNSTHSMHVSQDRRLFQTVSMVDFSASGDKIFSVGYDNMLRSWDKQSNAVDTLSKNLNLEANVDLLAVNKLLFSSGDILATGSQKSDDSISIIRSDDSGLSVIGQFSSPKAHKFPTKKIYPSCLKWAGGSSSLSSLLVGGFAASSGEQDLDTNGEVCVWNVSDPNVPITLSQGARGVFDCSWHPYSAAFAVGCRAGTNVNKGFHSVIKAYWPDSWIKWQMRFEFECEALDMNDVLWSPVDTNIITAGCTNGKVYVWDIRKPSEYLHVLTHGRPLVELGDNSIRQRELLDTGIRFSAWGPSRSRFYSGSSDGVVKAWDLYRAPDDALMRDIVTLHSGIMCGAFNPDFTSLAIGEVNGTITVLEVGHDDMAVQDANLFDLVSAPDDFSESLLGAEPPSSESGIEASHALIESGQIVFQPMGSFPVGQAVQGPNYESRGTYDRSEEAPVLRESAAFFQKRLAAAYESSLGISPCQLPACHAHERTSFWTSEVDDSGRSEDRIPHSLRRAQANETKYSATLAKARCVRCHGLARPGARETGHLLCEFCDFACFRCGEPIVVHRVDDEFLCERCDASWRADLLGFKLLRRPGNRQNLENKCFSKIVEKKDCILTLDSEEDFVDARDDYNYDLCDVAAE